MTKLPIAPIIFIYLLTAIVDCAQAADSGARPAKLARMRLSQSTVNTCSAILWVAKAQGFFAKYGLDVEPIFLQSSNLQTAALATNEVQIGNIGGATVLSGAAGGQPFRIIASPSNQLFYDLVARPEIKDGKDRRGKRIGVTSIGGAIWMSVNTSVDPYSVGV